MCIFCKIITKEIPSDIIYEDADVLAFRDIHPLAPVHVLIIPKKHIETINDLTDADGPLVGKMILAAQKLARELQTAEFGYKLLFRVGVWGGQEVPHIHLHLIGGAKLQESIKPIT
jgi:histidine triad (HIT) family protein